MKLSEFAIKDFGVLRGVNGTFAPRLSVVWGENAGGKTTLVDFIRRALFYESASQDDLRPSKASRASGTGTLCVLMDDGRRLEVALSGPKKFVENVDNSAKFLVTAESAAKEDLLSFKVLPFSVETFDRVSVVGLDDMQSLSRLSGKELEDRLFSAETGLGTASFSEFMARLDKLEKEIYVPAGGADCEASLNKIWTEIGDAGLEIEELKTRNARCRELWNALKAKRDSLDEVREKLKRDRQRLLRLEAISEAQPVWLEAGELEDALAAMGPRHAKPGGGAASLNALLEKAAHLRERVERLEQKREHEELHCRQLQVNPLMSLLTYREALEDLEKETERIRSVDAEVSLLSAEAREQEETLKRALSDFAPHWGESDLAESDLSLAAEQAANTFRDNFRVLNEHRSALFRKSEAETLHMSALQAQLSALRDRLNNFESEFVDFQERKKLFLEIRGGLLRNDALFWEIRGEKMCADVLEEERQTNDDPPRRQGSYMAKFLLTLLLLLSGTVIALGILEPSLRPYDVYGVLFCCLVSLFPASALFMDKREYRSQMELWITRRKYRNDKLDTLNKRISSQRQEMRSIAAAIEQKAQNLGVRMPSMMKDLDDIAEQLEKERNQSYDLEGRQIEEKCILQEVEECAGRRNQIGKELANLNKDLEKALEQWRTWLSQNRFNSALTPEQFDSFLTGARNAREFLRFLDILRSKIHRCEEYTASIDARIRALGGTIGLNLDKENLETIFRSLKEALELKNRVEASFEALRLLSLECSEAGKEMASAVEEVQAFYGDVGVEGETAFRVLLEECERREAMEARLAELRRTLAAFFGEATADTSLESDFSMDFLVQREEIKELQFAVEEGENTLDFLNADVEDLERQTASIVSDDRLFVLRQKREALRNRGKQQLRRWLAVVLTKYFAAKVMERHVKNRQPEIMREARQILSLMTQNRRGAAGAETNFLKMLESGKRRLNDARKFGLTDQAYLSLRLATACSLSERGEAVPVILDNVFARFDETRQREAMEALWQVSEKIQIVLLTCHRFTAEMFRARLTGEEGFATIEIPERETGALLKARAKKREKIVKK